jgi:hypothetical protein
MLRMLVFLTFAAVLAFFGATVKLGQRTFFGHVRAIWATDEAQDMRKGLGEKAGPALDRVKRGVEAGIKAATREDGGAVEPGEPGGAGGQDGGPVGDAEGEGVTPPVEQVTPPAQHRPAKRRPAAATP